MMCRRVEITQTKNREYHSVRRKYGDRPGLDIPARKRGDIKKNFSNHRRNRKQRKTETRRKHRQNQTTILPVKKKKLTDTLDLPVHHIFRQTYESKGKKGTSRNGGEGLGVEKRCPFRPIHPSISGGGGSNGHSRLAKSGGTKVIPAKRKVYLEEKIKKQGFWSC